MKKVITAMALVAASVLPISAITAVPSFAAPTTKTLPTTKQLPKQKFWDLEVGSITVKGQVIKIGSGNHTINVKVGETVTFTCTYKTKSSPVGDITPADAQYWGSGNHQYAIRFQIYFPIPNLAPKTLFKNRSLPKFTYEDAKNWHLRPEMGKVWDQEVEFQWTPELLHTAIPSISVVYVVDVNHVISEINEQNNEINTAGGLLTIVVSQ
jgi:hypothetical protein